jgi:paraquat-inducible protein B
MKARLKPSADWLIWLFPALAILVCVSLLLSYWQQRGPTIKIYFPDASNVQVEKTKVRFRGVEIGTVKSVTISKNTEEAVVTVSLQRSASHVAVNGSKFWIVTPKVDLQGVSGLDTLISGSYIAVNPGPIRGEIQKEFRGKVGQKSGDSLEDTVAYYLDTKALESVSEGDFVTYRGLKVGSVTRVQLSKTAQTIGVQINIQDKYVRLIRTNTVFWRKVGVQAKLGLFKSELKISSLESLLHGGVAFSTPDSPGKIAKALSRFALNSEPPKDADKWNPNLEYRAEVVKGQP